MSKEQQKTAQQSDSEEPKHAESASEDENSETGNLLALKKTENEETLSEPQKRMARLNQNRLKPLLKIKKNENLVVPGQLSLKNKTSLELQKSIAPNLKQPKDNSNPKILLQRAFSQLKCLDPSESLKIINQIQGYFLKRKMLQQLAMSQYTKITCQVLIDRNLSKYIKSYKQLKKAAAKDSIDLKNFSREKQFMIKFTQVAFYVWSWLGYRNEQRNNKKKDQQVFIDKFWLHLRKDKNLYQVQLILQCFYEQNQLHRNKIIKSKYFYQNPVQYNVFQENKQKIFQGKIGAQNIQLHFLSLLRFLKSHQSLQSIRLLEINCCTDIQKGCRYLSTQRLQNLKQLNIRSQQFSDENCKDLVSCTSPLLEKIIIDKKISLYFIRSDCVKITAKGFEQFRVWSNLTQISLDYNLIGNTGCKYVARAGWEKLKSLSLKKNGITEDGIKHLIKAKLPNLLTLSLNQNQISPRGHGLLTKALWPRLKQIFLSQQINQQAFKRLVVTIQSTEDFYGYLRFRQHKLVPKHITSKIDFQSFKRKY